MPDGTFAWKSIEFANIIKFSDFINQFPQKLPFNLLSHEPWWPVFWNPV